MCLFYRKPDSCGRARPPPARHLVVPSREWHVRAFAGTTRYRKRRLQRCQRPRAPKAEAVALVPRGLWIFYNCPLQMSQEKKKSKHTICTHSNSTQPQCLKLTYCRWLG